MSEIVTRFAPSPTGFLHLGHAYSAWFAAERGTRFILRIEDIDLSRCRPEFEDAIFEDLSWLGLDWDYPVRRQSDHFDDYRAALDRLWERDLLYPCFCTRSDIQREIAAAGNAPHGPDGPLYPGTCRRLEPAERERRMADGEPYALRLNAARAARLVGSLTWRDRVLGEIAVKPMLFGDVVLARKDVPTSYHLAVTLDDYLQGVTLVTRGEDLVSATHVQRVLQALLDLRTPEYHHHALLTDAQGKRFAKRDKSLTIRALRAAGSSPAAVRAMVTDGSRRS